MWLARAATIELSDPPPQGVVRGNFAASNRCIVKLTAVRGAEAFDSPPDDRTRAMWAYSHESAVLGVSVTVDAGPPAIKEGKLCVPREPRERAEDAIDEYADFLAVTYQCRRIVRSPMAGCVAMAAMTDDERTALVGVVEMHSDETAKYPTARVLPTLAPGDLQPLMTDRPDGVALLADALSEPNPAARAREFFRLFERAFAKAGKYLVNPLAEFLASNPRHDALAYSRDEVRHWVQTLRPETVHGDDRRLARSADVQPYLGRLEVAMYDVVLNKANWHRGDTARRAGHALHSAVQADRKGVVLLDPRVAIRHTWTDRFGRFPTDWNARLALAPEWIWAGLGQRDGFNREEALKGGWDLH